MIGRVIGVVAGVLVAVFGYGLWKPANIAKLIDPGVMNFATLPLGPFDPYRTVIAFTLMGLGVVIALAAIQRKAPSRRKRRGPLHLGGADADKDPFRLSSEPTDTATA